MVEHQQQQQAHGRVDSEQLKQVVNNLDKLTSEITADSAELANVKQRLDMISNRLEQYTSKCTVTNYPPLRLVKEISVGDEIGSLCYEDHFKLLLVGLNRDNQKSVVRCFDQSSNVVREFEVDTDWIYCIAVNLVGHCYIGANNKVLVYTVEGIHLSTLPIDIQPSVGIRKVISISFDRDQCMVILLQNVQSKKYLPLSDIKCSVLVYDIHNNVKKQIDADPTSTCLTIDSDNHALVCKHRDVVEYNQEGEVVSYLNNEDNQLQISFISSAVIDQKGHLLIIDCGNSNLQVYSADRKRLLYQMNDKLKYPRHVISAFTNQIYVSDQTKVLVFEQNE